MAEADVTLTNSGIASEKRALPRRKWSKTLLMVSVPLALGLGGIYYYVTNDHYVSTDNAYVQQDKVSVSAEVGGRIVAVAVGENQRVTAGDLLFRIDPQPYRIAVAQSDASIASAQVKVIELQTAYRTTGVDIAQAQEGIAFAQTEYRRQSALMERGFTTRARLQTAEHALNDARSRLAGAQAEAQEARAALSSGAAVPTINPAVRAGLAQREKAMLDLARTEIRAPASGIISQADRLHIGQMMVSGLPAVSIVSSNRSWIEANFKETDLNKMRVGQSAKITFDAYPDLELNGHVASIGAGTGSEFSVLPAQNANGNWVKVTQRVPVRIAIDSETKRQMIAGLSAHIRIDTSSGGK